MTIDRDLTNPINLCRYELAGFDDAFEHTLLALADRYGCDEDPQPGSMYGDAVDGIRTAAGRIYELLDAIESCVTEMTTEGN